MVCEPELGEELEEITVGTVGTFFMLMTLIVRGSPPGNTTE